MVYKELFTAYRKKIRKYIKNEKLVNSFRYVLRCSANNKFKKTWNGRVTVKNKVMRGVHKEIENRILKPEGLSMQGFLESAKVSSHGTHMRELRLSSKKHFGDPKITGARFMKNMEKIFFSPAWISWDGLIPTCEMEQDECVMLRCIKCLNDYSLVPIVSEIPVGIEKLRLGTRVDLIVFCFKTNKLHVVEIKFSAAKSWHTVSATVSKACPSTPRAMAFLQAKITAFLAQKTFEKYEIMFGQPAIMRISMNSHEFEFV